MSTDDLTNVRHQIDNVDEKIVKLLKERASLAVQTAKLKQEKNPNAAIYRPERESQILRHIMETNTSQLPDQALAQIFRDIMSACLALQQQLTISFLGPRGTFSQSAAVKHFGKSVLTQPVTSIDRVFREVECGNAHYGVVPIENSIEGRVNQTLDTLMSSPLYICGEITIPIHQHLLRHPQDDKPVERIYSHQQAFSQCGQWLDQNYSKVDKVTASSTAKAAEIVVKEKGVAAIASETAAEIYDLEIITHNIEGNPNNTTRFLIIGKHAPTASGKDKTSLLITTPHEPGSLLKLIQPFSKNDVNLTLIESRPYQHQNWRYVFFIDIEGHEEDAKVKKALDELSQMPIILTVLGSYPSAVL
ncbi:MAG: prephenate dehydratase [Gammaproteobacteria bacterium]